MSKKQSTHRQATFFKKEIPQMPEGYYSSGPNPNLRRFVEEHATPYDPATDDYLTRGFSKSVVVGNRRDPINDLHIYWSKKPYQAIRQYIRHFTSPDAVVLDPFCGSGTTAFAALIEDRSIVATDLSPASTFITKNYCTAQDPSKVDFAFREIERVTKAEIDWLYETRCDRCDGRAVTSSMVHSAVYQCTRCLKEVPLFDCETHNITATSGKHKDIKVCPYCYARGHIEEIVVGKNPKVGVIPVETSYQCIDGCKPARVRRRHNDVDPKKNSYFHMYDLGKLSGIDSAPIPYWYPTSRMLDSPEDRKAWGLLWRPYHDGVEHVDEFYTKRSLRALSKILSAINDLEELEELEEIMQFAFSGSLYNATKMYRYRKKGGGPQPGNYYMPPIFVEVRVWTLFEQKVKNIIKASSIWEDFPPRPRLCISTQSATNLDAIPNNSIDYIFTDPPYSWKVQYGELNYLWEAWLGFDSGWLDREIIINDNRDKSADDWARGIRDALAECSRVLKPGRWLSLCYHDSSEGTWQLVQDITAEIGFIPESAEGTVFIDTGQKSYHQLMDKKVTKRDLVINFRKPRPGELTQLTLLGNEDESTFIEKAQAILTEMLEQHPGSTIDRLYDELVSRMVRKGEYERHDFDSLLRSVAEDVDSRWYLKETADQIDAAESAKEEESATRLESSMQAYLEVNPSQQGVHYSDLFEQYLPVADKPRRLLQNWLPDFFFKTGEGTWRPPANEEEREQRAALRASGVLRRIKRFGNALLDGVPPADRDRPENVATAADWIRQCRKAGLYELGRTLYEKGGFSLSELSEEALLEVEEDYQICVRRSA